jgi:secreted trypsin-like serine protease
MPPRPRLREHDEARVRAAIARADREAPGDHAAFLEALNDGYYGRLRRRALTGIRPGRAPDSFEMARDDRYLGNARELARRGFAGTRVVGGQAVRSQEYADCVAVGCDDAWQCTGTLISARAVVTAGHCADCATRVFFGNDVSRRGVVVGVKARVRHPRYHKGRHNDLMVLILRKEAPVAPRRLADARLIERAADARVVGFGNTNVAGTLGYGRKRMVDVPIASPACRGGTRGRDDAVSYGCDPGFELVAGKPLLERDSCSGDSGGPLYVAAKGGEWRLAGVTSRATDSALHECGDGGIYARIDRYRSWLRAIPGVRLA